MNMGPVLAAAFAASSLSLSSLHGMRLVTFSAHGVDRLGAVVEDRVVDLNRSYERLLSEKGNGRSEALAEALVPPDVVRFLEGGEASLQAAREALAWVEERWRAGDGEGLRARGVLYALGQVRLRAAVPRPRSILAMGLNYRKHAEETGQPVPEYPIVFSKEGSVVGPGEAIVIPAAVAEPDYEGELAFVIGRQARRVPRGRGMDYVAGYCVFNDVTARDFQRRGSQWTLGKSPDTFAAIGPYLVLKDSVPNPHALRLKTLVGDEILQDSSTEDLIFKIPEIVEYISQVLTLEPGTVIATGTRPGVGSARTPKRWLRPGEVVRVEIERLGSLENPIRRE